MTTKFQRRRSRFDQLAKFGFGPNVMKQTRICPNCESLVTDGAEVCPRCGNKLPEITLLTLYEEQHPVCPDCGTVLSDDVQYCPQCGKRIFQKKEK